MSLETATGRAASKPDLSPSHRRPTEALSARLRGGRALVGALDDELADELRQRGEHVEDEPSARSGGVERLFERPEADPALAQTGDDGDEVM
jgi:hypothetical protein